MNNNFSSKLHVIQFEVVFISSPRFNYLYNLSQSFSLSRSLSIYVTKQFWATTMDHWGGFALEKLKKKKIWYFYSYGKIITMLQVFMKVVYSIFDIQSSEQI